MTHGVVLLLLAVVVLFISLYILYIFIIDWRNTQRNKASKERNQKATESKAEPVVNAPPFDADSSENASKHRNDSSASHPKDEDVSEVNDLDEDVPEFNDMDEEIDGQVSSSLNEAFEMSPSAIYG